MISINHLPYLWEIIDIIPLLYEKVKSNGCIKSCFHLHQDEMSKDGRIKHLIYHSLWKNRWPRRLLFSLFVSFNLGPVIKVSAQTFLMVKNISSWKKFEINTRLLYLYGNLQIILRFHENKYTVNSQLQCHVDKQADLRTLWE